MKRKKDDKLSPWKRIHHKFISKSARRRIEMVIKITKGYVDFMYKGRIVRGWGDMCEKDFRIIASTVEWLFPGEKRKLNDEERSEFIEEVMKYEHQTREKYKKVFEDDNGKKIKGSKRKI